MADYLVRHIVDGEKADALPQLELMPYHEGTIARWRKEGLPREVRSQAELHAFFGLTRLEFFCAFPDLDCTGCRGEIVSREDFAAIRNELYDLEKVRSRLDAYTELWESVEASDGILWIPMHGFFWHPRDLFGVAEHFMMFYDEPDLIDEINKALLEFNIGVVQLLAERRAPSIICVSEDMAYRSGSMISSEMFSRFLAPYHRVLSAEIKRCGCIAAIDTDGEISALIPLFSEVGYQCISPIERQTGMNVLKLKEDNPKMAFMGGFDKLVLSKGPTAIGEEFARLKPAFRKGRFVPAVDHQTPPEVSLENYCYYIEAARTFLREMLSE